MVSRHFGSVASSTVRNFGVEKLPLVSDNEIMIMIMIMILEQIIFITDDDN